jgi:hypothetical protein
MGGDLRPGRDGGDSRPGRDLRRRAAICALDATALLGRVGVAAMLWPWRVAHVIEYF